MFGGFMVDSVCEPFMAANISNGIFTGLFGSGKGSGAALMMFILGVAGVVMCLVSGQRLKRYKYVDP